MSSYLSRSTTRVPSSKELLWVPLLASTFGLLGWFAVFVPYNVLLNFGLISKGDFFLSTAVFIVDFPQPDRPYLAMGLSTLYMLCFLLSVRLNARRGRVVLDTR
jgi:hypothetical protein